MKLTKDSNTADYVILGYGDNYININGEEIHHSMIISPDHLLSPWLVKSMDDLTEDTINAVFSVVEDPALILLGTGKTLVFPDQSHFKTIYDRRIGIEVMDTKAACRTYQILMAEGRNVVCAMIVDR